MPNEFIVKNGLVVGGNVVTSGTITINGALAATQSWVTSQAYLTSASLSGYATQSYVTSALAALVDSAPAALDTLNELAAALGDDANFSTTITNSIASKQSQLNGTGLVRMSGTSVSYDNTTYLISNFGNIEGDHTYGYPSSNGWYKIAEVVFNGACQSYNLWGEYRDTGYFDNSHFRIHITARAECDFPSNNESHAINVNIYGSSTNDTYFSNNVRVVLTQSSSNYRKYELQYYRETWDTGSWRLQTIGWTVYQTSQTAGSATGTPRVYYVSKFSTDNIFVANKISIGTTYAGFAANIAGTTYIIGASAWVNDGYGITNASSPGTGFFPYSDGNSVISSNNTTRLFVNGSTGNIGIGTSSPGKTLDIAGEIRTSGRATFNEYVNTGFVYGNTDLVLAYSGGTTGILINSSGNVGIGTTNPGGKLEVKTGGTSGWDKLVVTNTTLWGDGSTQYVTIGAGGATGIMMFNPHVVWNSASGTAALRLGRSGGVSSGSWYEVGTGASDSFFIAKDGFYQGPQLYINSAGNIGIGTTSPASKLQVAGDIRIQNETGLITDYGPLVGRYNTSQVYVGTGGSYSIVKIARADGGALNVLSGGNVGIGTDSPNYKLDVNGSINIFSGNSLRWGSGDAEIINSGYSLLFKTYNGSSLAEAMRINSAGKVSIGTTDTNSDKSDFTVYTGSGASLALTDDQVRMGSTDVNWGVALRSYGALQTYGQALTLNTQAGNYAVNVQPNGTTVAQFYQDYSYFPGLDFSISRVNGVHASNYFRGDTSHLVIGTSGTLYLNYGGSTTIITGNTTVSGGLGVSGIVSAGARKLSMGILDLNSGITPTQYKIKTNIPWNYGGSDFTVNIKGFRYGVGQMVSLSIGWHFYNDEFYNRNAISNGAWAPTISLAKSSDGYVIIYIPGPDYWPKLYIESVYSSNSADSYTSGWSWTDADLSDCTLIQTVPYKALATNISGNAATATSATTAGALSSMNISQFTNNSGYITGYTETDTLASVTNRGESTTGRINVRGPGNQGGGNIMMGNTGESINKWSYLTSTHYNASSQPQGFALIGGLATSGGNAVVIGGNIYETNPATEIQFWTHGTNTHNLGGTQRGVINSSGNWGIGTNTPSKLLEVAGDIMAGTSNKIGFRYSGGDSNFYNYITADNANPLTLVGGMWTASGATEGIRFSTYNGAALSILNNGNVGIGTTSPAQKLHVQGSNLMATFQNSSTGGDHYTQLEFIAGSRSAYIWLGNQSTTSWAGDGGLNLYTTTGNMDFWTATTQRMRLTAGGNLGIGTTSPGWKLHVAGESYTSGVVRIGGTNPFYFEDYGGGWYMADSTWIRTYNSKSVWTAGGLLGSEGGLTVGYGGSTPPSGGAIIAGNVGVGTSSPGYKLEVNGTLGVNGNATFNGGNVYINSDNSYIGNNTTDLVSLSGGTMYLPGNGNVGIGTTAPAIPRGSGFRPMLHVYNNSAGTNPAIVVSAEDSQMAGYIAGDNAGGSDIGWGWNAYYQGNGNNFYNIRIGDNGTWTDRFTIDRYGKVGIGTTSPSENLHVLGRGIFDGGSGNSSTDAVLYVTKSNNNDWGLYVNAAALDYGMYARVSPSANYAIAVNNGTSWTTRITGDGRIYLNEKDTIASYDTWLRLNESSHYGSGVYTPGVMRADGGFNVSGSTVWHAGNDGSGSGLDADLLDGNHASYFINTSNIGSQSVSYASSAGSAGSATTSTSTYRGIIEDTRAAERTPSDYDDYRVSWEFTNQIPGLNYGGTSWWSVMTMQGWHNGYSAWQIIGSSSSAIDDFYLRAGNNTTWNTARRIWHSGDFTSTNVSNWNTAYGWGNHASASYATTSYVTTQINNLIAGAPGALDTLDELAAALGDDSNFATTVTNSIASKLSLSGGTMTGQILFQTSALNNGFRWDVNSDAAGITFKNTGDGDANSYFNFFTEDNGNEYFKFSHNTWNIGSFDFMDVKNGVVRTNGDIYVNASQSGSRSAGTNELINGSRVWHSGDFSSTNVSNWDTAYGWGNHASAGYALNSALANYLPLSGGSIGGALTVNGNLTVNGTITENSSIKLKENVETSEGNLEKVVNLRPVTYNKIGSQTTELGLIAEEVAEVYPEFVQYDENGDPIGVHYSRLTAALIGAVKELTNQVQELNKKING